MRFRTGDRVIDSRGREVMLECRAYMGRVLVWMAQPVINGHPSEEHCIIVMEHEIKATKQPEGFQFLLA